MWLNFREILCWSCIKLSLFLKAKQSLRISSNPTALISVVRTFMTMTPSLSMFRTLAQRDSHLATLSAQGYSLTAVDFATILQDIENCTQSSPGQIDSTKNGFSVFKAIKPGPSILFSFFPLRSFSLEEVEPLLIRVSKNHERDIRFFVEIRAYHLRYAIRTE